MSVREEQGVGTPQSLPNDESPHLGKDTYVLIAVRVRVNRKIAMELERIGKWAREEIISLSQPVNGDG